MKASNPNDLNFIIDMSAMAPKSRRDWGFSSIPGGWSIPQEIEIDEESGTLCWNPTPDPAGRVEPTPELLKEFLKIEDAKTWVEKVDAIHRFARQWGPLHLCAEHLWPVWHQLDNRGLHQPGGPMLPICPPMSLPDGRLAEPLWGWYLYALTARDIVHAGALAQPRKARQTTRPGALRVDSLLVKPDPEAVVAKVRGWIENSGGYAVFPEWTSNDTPPVWRAEVRTLAAALGVALWTTLQESTSQAICVSCHAPLPIRQRNQQYCPACQREHWKVNKARWRASQAAAVTRDPEYVI